MSIFISINAKDKDIAQSLEQTLLKWGFSDVWMMDYVGGGKDWPQKILDSVHLAKVCILAVTKSGLTFTQGVEIGAATAQRMLVIPLELGDDRIAELPNVLRRLQTRTLVDPNNFRQVLDSRLIHDLHPFYVSTRARSEILDLARLITRAIVEHRIPKTKLSRDELKLKHSRIRVRAYKGSVAEATKGQRLAAVLHLTRHDQSTDFVNFLKDGLDIHFQDEFNKLTDWLRNNGVSDQIILRTCVLADAAALHSWGDTWNIK